MPVAVLQHLIDSLLGTLQLGLSGPVELGQPPGLLEVIAARVGGTLPPVDPPDELSPADDLADEALDRVQRSCTFSIGLERLLYAFARVEQLQVERR